MTVYEVLEKYGKGKGKDYSRAKLKSNYDQYVNLWKSYYSGDVPGVNIDTAYNGEESYEIKRLPMRLAKIIATRWATQLFSEAFKITLKDDTETEKFRQLEKQIAFRSKINEAAIGAYSLGTAVLLASAAIDKESITGDIKGGKVKLDVLPYDSIYPLVYDKDDIKSVAFIRQEQGKDTTTYIISIHTMENEKVVVETVKATTEGDTVDFSAAETVTLTQTFNNQMFCFFKPNILNDYTTVLPFGQSIFADSLASCIDVDLSADLLRRDIQEGPQLTFVGRDLLMEKLGKDGKKKKLFENTKGRFFTIPQDLAKGGGSLKQLFEKSVPEIRVAQIWEAIKNALNWACMTSGLGKDSLDIVPMATATQVIHSSSERMQNKSLHEQYLEGEIIKLVRSLGELSGMVGVPIDTSEISITWEDSIVVDTEEQKKLSMLEIDAIVVSKAEYRMKYFGETEEEARIKIEELEAENVPGELYLQRPQDVSEMGEDTEAAKTEAGSETASS
jgi:A118 family predicted phage portal protein